MNVLHIFNEIRFSGAEMMYYNAASFLKDRGIKIIALSTGEQMGEFSDKFNTAGIEVFHIALPNSTSSPLALSKYIKKVCALIKEQQIDVVHIHRSTFKWINALCAFICGKNAIYTAHNVFKNRKITWVKAYLERMTARKFLKLQFQTIGDSVYNNELKYYRNPSVKVNNWYNGERFFPAESEERRLLREELKLTAGDFVIVSTGACSKIKNHADILKALQLISESVPFVYLHLGKGVTECEEQDLATTLGLADRIRFLGNQLDVRKYLVAADVFVMPSLFEGLSIASIEAMACKLPSILYNSPGLRDLIDNNDNGFLIEADYRQLADKIEYYYKHPDVAHKKAENALNFVRKEFSMENSVTKIIDLYRQPR